MSPRVDATVTSPISVEDKVQDGRIQKPKAKKKDGAVPNYSINGRTFACEGCKNGHRVSKCTHAAQRPVLMTNDPGRPSADQKRRCDCPKMCQCTKKNCKCDRNCTCMQTMYMLVFVPFGDKEKDEERQKGEWKIGRTIITDLKGKELTEDEIEVRKQEKSRPRQGKPSRTGTIGAANGRLPSQDPMARFAASVSISTEDSATIPTRTPKSGCCSGKNLQNQRPIMEVKSEHNTLVQATRLRGHCNCGDNCGCAICLDHPNNAASHKMVQQRAAELSSNRISSQGGAIDQNHRTCAEEKSLSCMGTIPQFAWHTNPDPSPTDFQALFGVDNMADGGYFINYPIHGYSFNSAAPEGSCCSSSMPLDHAVLSGSQASSQFPSLGDPNAELMTPPPLDSNPDFTTALAFRGHIASQSDFPPSVTLGDGVFPEEPYVGQATVAGVYGTGDNWSDFCARHPLPQLWSPPSSDFDHSANASSVGPDFNGNLSSFSNMALSSKVNHFDTPAALTSLPSKPQTLEGSGLPGYETQYPHPLLGRNPSLKPDYFSPTGAPPSIYTPGDFANLELEPVDFFADTAASSYS